MHLGRILGIAVVALTVAAPAFALNVKKQIQTPAAPAKAWNAIGDFCGLATWLPAVAGCQLSRVDGVVLRTLSLNGGGTVVEKLIRWDARKRSYTYGIVSGPLPVANYVSTLSVAPAGKGSVVSWTGDFAAAGAPDDKAVATIAGLYDSGLASLAKELSR
jgi:hypothetical protein